MSSAATPGAGLISKPIISQHAYFASLGSFFGVAIIAFISRIAIRLWKFGSLSADDYFLFLATAALIISTVLAFLTIPAEFFFASVIEGEAPVPLDFFQRAVNTTIYGLLSQIFSWLSIFAVKFSFMFYFRALIRRIRPLMIWWWITLAVLIPLGSTTVISGLIVCPHTGADYLQCTLQPDFSKREQAILWYSVASDLITDLMLVAIPIALLRMAKFSMKQKFSIGIFLCLSIFMIFIALLRAISGKLYSTTDLVWVAYWVEIESCIAVTMVSMTAFRTLFVVNEKTGGIKKSPNMRKKYNNEKKQKFFDDTPTPRDGLVGSDRTAETERNQHRKWYEMRKQAPPDPHALPSIDTGATMTGMRSMIWGKDRDRTSKGTLNNNTMATTTTQNDSNFGTDEEAASTIVPSTYHNDPRYMSREHTLESGHSQGRGHNSSQRYAENSHSRQPSTTTHTPTPQTFTPLNSAASHERLLSPTRVQRREAERELEDRVRMFGGRDTQYRATVTAGSRPRSDRMSGTGTGTGRRFG